MDTKFNIKCSIVGGVLGANPQRSQNGCLVLTIDIQSPVYAFGEVLKKISSSDDFRIMIKFLDRSVMVSNLDGDQLSGEP